MACAESRLKCFLHYGSEDPAYISSRAVRLSFNPSKVKSVVEILENEELSKNVVPTIVKVFRGGYSVEPYASLYALALVIRKSNKKRNKLICEAYKAARKLSEDSTEYFLTFTYFLREIAKSDSKKGFGKGWRMTVQKWYESKDALTLAQTVSKVASVMNWSHKDIIALCRMKYPSDPGKLAVIDYLRNGFKSASDKYASVPEAKEVLEYLKSVEQIKRAGDKDSLINSLRTFDFLKYSFFIEYCPTHLLKEHDVWLMLIPKMNIECLLSNINRISKLKLFKHRSVVQEVVQRFDSLDLVDVNIHPTHVFILRKEYELKPTLAIEFQYLQRRRTAENSVEGNAENDNSFEIDVEEIERQPPPRRIPEIINCLSALFNKSLSTLAPTGLRYLIAIDPQSEIENRMCYRERFVTVAEACLLIALCVINAESESNVKLVTFTAEDGYVKEIPVNKTDETMESLKNKIIRLENKPANLHKLIDWATKEQEKFDVIILLSDHTFVTSGAFDALKTYKQKVSERAKIIACSFSGKHKKIKELKKKDMFLICGFSKDVGRLIEAYSRGAF